MGRDVQKKRVYLQIHTLSEDELVVVGAMILRSAIGLRRVAEKIDRDHFHTLEKPSSDQRRGEKFPPTANSEGHVYHIVFHKSGPNQVNQLINQISVRAEYLPSFFFLFCLLIFFHGEIKGKRG